MQEVRGSRVDDVCVRKRRVGSDPVSMEIKDENCGTSSPIPRLRVIGNEDSAANQ